jgi:hypothetical protein
LDPAQTATAKSAASTPVQYRYIDESCTYLLALQSMNQMGMHYKCPRHLVCRSLHDTGTGLWIWNLLRQQQHSQMSARGIGFSVKRFPKHHTNAARCVGSDVFKRLNIITNNLR